MRDGAAADGRILVVVHLVLVDPGRVGRLALLVGARERPQRGAVEQRVVAAGQHAVEDLVVTVLAVVVHRA